LRGRVVQEAIDSLLEGRGGWPQGNSAFGGGGGSKTGVPRWRGGVRLTCALQLEREEGASIRCSAVGME